MRTYKIRYDASTWIVEAPGFAAAILVWENHVSADDPAWNKGTPPESVELLDYVESVIRLHDNYGWCENAARCGSVASKTDAEGVRLCKACYDECGEVEG